MVGVVVGVMVGVVVGVVVGFEAASCLNVLKSGWVARISSGTGHFDILRTAVLLEEVSAFQEVSWMLFNGCMVDVLLFPSSVKKKDS